MKVIALRILLIAIATAAAPMATCFGQRPGTEEAADVDRANAEIDRVYKNLMSVLDEQQQTALREAERAWVVWRDAEANLMARFTSEGGSAYREDHLTALTTLIDQRTAVLKDYLKKVQGSR